MSPELSLSEQMTYGTVRIECEAEDGLSTGTGFFFRFLEHGDNYVPAIVTNKHVVKGAVRGRIHFTLQGSEGQPLPGQHAPYVLEQFQQQWIHHPDSEVDLCILPIASLLEHAASENKQLFFISLDKSLIPTPEDLSDLTALEDVVMIGYPNGIWDSMNNMPIIRRGITATHPNLDYEGNSEFMIDAACFPGSSGSPVFLFNLGGYTTKTGGTVIGPNRVKLLGILYAGPQHTATGEIQIVDVPTTQQAVAFSRIPNNLGLVIKAHRLLELDSILSRLIESSET